MSKISNKKILFVISAIISFIIVFSSTSIAAGQAVPPSDAQQKLEGISEEEKKVLQNLFTLAQEIAVLEREEKELAGDIEALKLEIKKVEADIAAEEAAFAKNQEGLKRILKSYQRMGPGSYLEIILNSDSLASFLKRINTLRDIARNTGLLLERLEESKERLAAEKARLMERHEMLEEKQKKSEEALAKKLELLEENQRYLDSLKEEKEYYQSYLAAVQQMWDELKPYFSEAASEFSRLIREGALPENAVKITFSLFSIKGSIEQDVFNDLISKQPKLSEMEFIFRPGKIEMNMPSRNLMLSGKLVISDDTALKLQVEEGSFYGMPLEVGSIEELFSEGDLIIDFKPVLGNHTLRSVEIKEEYLELYIR